ncbi:hypothetical protein M3Y97_00393800 [Aphelenchoides bicaudatus]|nr:hypothetical protein M3Y97_00393800 [Aphelenchoides bicaudatus]
MSAAYQQNQYSNNFQAMDFPSDFLEPSISSAPTMQTKVNPMFSPNTGCSSANSSLSSSRNRLAYDDSGVSSNVTLATEADPSSSMHFLSTAINSGDCMEQNQIGLIGNDFFDDLEPMVRGRCNTWPMKTGNDFRSNNMTIQEGIQEEDEPNFYSKHASQTSVRLSQDLFINNNSNPMNAGYPVQHANSQEQELNYDSHNDYSDENSRGSAGEEDYQDDYQGGAAQKRSQTRRNAWGNMSYADLITQAILSSPDQRLTLSQIYEWMVANVPYFADKGDSNSSAGWKLDCRMDDSPFTTEFRDRCNTWPLKCLLAEESQSSIPEPFQIQCYEDSNHSIQSFNTTADSSLLNIGPTAFPTLESWATDSYGFPPTVQAHNYPYQQAGPSTSAFDNVQSNRWDAKEEEDQLEWNSNFCRQSQDSGQRKMNPWGEASYADLITKALENAPNKRLKLNEIYQWFSDNVPYFHERSTPELSAGWKWIINPDSKNRNPRRRQTIDATTKHAIEKKRRGARKRVEMQQQNSMNSLSGARKASQPDFYFNQQTKEEFLDDSSDYGTGTFRSRTLSNVSAPGGSQVSPTFNPNNEDFTYHQSWVSNNANQREDMNNVQYNNCSTMKEIMNRTDQITLDTDGDLNQMAPMNTSQQLGVFSTMRQQVSPNFQEDIKPQFQQGSYQELKPVRDVDQRLQNPLLQQYSQPAQFQQQTQFVNQQSQQNDYPFGRNNLNNQQRWQMNNGQQANRFVPQNGGIQQMQTVVESPMVTSAPVSQPTTMASNFSHVPMGMPKDLEDLSAFVPPDCDLHGIDAIIQEELSTTTTTLNFDF